MSNQFLNTFALNKRKKIVAMKRLISCFLQGLLYITPIAATVYVLFYIFRVANNIIGDLGILGSYDIPGVGLDRKSVV